MIADQIIGVILALVAAAGLGLCAAWVLLSAKQTVERAAKLMPRKRILLRRFFAGQNAAALELEAGPTRKSWNWGTALPIGGGLILAVLARDWLLTPYLLAAGAALAWFFQARRQRKNQAQLTDQARALVVLFRSRFSASESPFAVLNDVEAQLPQGQVRRAVRRTVDIFRARGDAQEAFAALRGLDSPYLARLVMVLETCGIAASDVILVELRQIEHDLKARDRLAAQARTSLALLKGTTTFLQAANLTAIAASVTLPLWRNFFTSSLQRRGTFLAATLFLILASLYFDQEIAQQEEKAL